MVDDGSHGGHFMHALFSIKDTQSRVLQEEDEELSGQLDPGVVLDIHLLKCLVQRVFQEDYVFWLWFFLWCLLFIVD